MAVFFQLDQLGNGLVQLGTGHDAGTDPRQRYLAFFGVWVLERNFDPAYDNSVRMWSRNSNAVATIVAKVEAERVEILQGIYRGFGYAAPQAAMRARVTYCHQVGYCALR